MVSRCCRHFHRNKHSGQLLVPKGAGPHRPREQDVPQSDTLYPTPQRQRHPHSLNKVGRPRVHVGAGGKTLFDAAEHSGLPTGKLCRPQHQPEPRLPNEKLDDNSQSPGAQPAERTIRGGDELPHDGTQLSNWINNQIITHSYEKKRTISFALCPLLHVHFLSSSTVNLESPGIGNLLICLRF